MRNNPRHRRVRALIERVCWMGAGLAMLSGCPRHAPEGPTLRRVTIRAFRFEPDSLTAVVGDTVEWLNADLVPHTASVHGLHGDSTVIPPRASWRRVLMQPGVVPYGCLLHPAMQAKLVVR